MEGVKVAGLLPLCSKSFSEFAHLPWAGTNLTDKTATLSSVLTRRTFA